MSDQATTDVMGPDRPPYEIMRTSREEIEELLRANVGPRGLNPFMLDRVKIPAGGQIYWSVPTPEGEVPDKQLKGIIIHFRDIRLFWIRRLSEGGEKTPPDCYSEDSFQGRGRRSDGEAHGGPWDCDRCPNSQFGSADGGGRLCQSRKVLFVMRERAILPTIVSLPPMSIGPVERFFVRLLGAKLPFYAAEVGLGLEPARNKAGQDYSRVTIALLRRLEAGEREAIKSARDSMLDALNKTRVEVEEQPEPGSNG